MFYKEKYFLIICYPADLKCYVYSQLEYPSVT